MGLRNAEQETLRRLDAKTLDAQLRQILVSGLNCSPFEANAVIEAAQEVYFPFFDAAGQTRARPGYVTLVAVAADEPAGKAVADCAKLNVSLQLHRGAADDQLLAREGPLGFRRQLIPELCQLRRGRGLIERYLELVEGCANDKLWSYHLEELLGVGRASGEKKLPGGRHGR